MQALGKKGPEAAYSSGNEENVEPLELRIKPDRVPFGSSGEAGARKIPAKRGGRSPELGRPASEDGERVETMPGRRVDFLQKNLDRLEALKARQAQEKAAIELQRDKTRRHQEKLKNRILREAEDNRAKKAAGLEVGVSEEMADILRAKRRSAASPEPANAEPEEDAEEKR